MMKKTTLALIAALAATGITSPVFAQSYSPGDGTGNVLPFAYGAGGIKQRSVAVPPPDLPTLSSSLLGATAGTSTRSCRPLVQRRAAMNRRRRVAAALATTKCS
jgi:hypothetical protein